MWSTYKTYRAPLSGQNYTRCFVSRNARATNDLKDKRSLAYCVNLYHHPYIRAYFEDAGVAVSEDFYALLTMVQWIWRSAVRDGESITVYVPSERSVQRGTVA